MIYEGNIILLSGITCDGEFEEAMKKIIATLLIHFFIYKCEAANYTTKYDGVNLDEILSNERLLNGYVNCLLDLGPCTPDGKELKKNLPDAIQNDCENCSAKQREGSDRVMHYIIDHRPEEWNKLEEKYNSDGSYKLKYLEKTQKDSHQDVQENIISVKTE